MSARDLIVVGGGEHAGVVLDAAQSRPDQWRVIGFADPQPCEPLMRRFSVRRLGDDAVALTHVGSAWFVIGVGALTSPIVREKIARRYTDAGARWAIVVHDRAHVSPLAELSGGAFVAAGAVVNPSTRIGAHCVVNTGAVVEHDCEIGPFAQVGPGAVVGGGVVVGERAFLGLGCRVRDHVHVGADVVVAMGAVVTRSVERGTVMGVPARSRSDA